MSRVYSIPQSFKEGVTNLLKDKYQLVSEWKGHLVRAWDSFLKEMKNRPQFAITVFTVANLIFFTLINNLAWSLERRINDIPQKLSAGNRRFNYILIDGAVVGGSVLTFNLMLSQLTQYPLSKTTIAAITVGSIALRYFLHIPVEDDEVPLFPMEDDEKEIELDDKIDEPKSPSQKKIVENNQKDDQVIQTPEKEQIDKVQAPKETQKKFIDAFCNEMHDILKNSFHYVNFEEDQKIAQDIFLEKMKQGIATIEDQPDLCRAVNVPIQAAFETLLCDMLTRGDVKKAKAIFLTPLPCTPLRTPLQNIDTENSAEWKKWTVDIRTQTVRNLRDAGLKIQAYYSNDDYQALPGQSVKGKSEFDTYEKEKKIEGTIDLPLAASIPKDLVGAVYFFTDANGNCYVLATQGIQIQNHGNTPRECWKMWFGAEDNPEIVGRTQEVATFLRKHRPL